MCYVAMAIGKEAGRTRLGEDSQPLSHRGDSETLKQRS